MLCGDTQSTKHMQGIQSVFAAPGSYLPVQAPLLSSPPMILLCTPASWNEWLILPSHPSLSEHTLSSAWNGLLLPDANAHLHKVDSSLLCANIVPCTYFHYRINYISITCLPACLSH